MIVYVYFSTPSYLSIGEVDGVVDKAGHHAVHRLVKELASHVTGQVEDARVTKQQTLHLTVLVDCVVALHDWHWQDSIDIKIGVS